MLSPKRLEYVCEKAEGATNEGEAAEYLTPDIMPNFNHLNSIFGTPPGGMNLINTWKALDVSGADCTSLAHLMVDAVELLGFTEGEVTFIYAQTLSWDGIEHDVGNSTHCEVNPTTFDFLIYTSGGIGNEIINTFEACYKVTDTFGVMYIPGGHISIKDSAPKVLELVASAPVSMTTQYWSSDDTYSDWQPFPTD